MHDVLDGFDLELWCIEQNAVSYMWQVVFSMFLFRVGLLTLMKMGALMDLARLCLSLPTMLKSSADVL